MLPIEQAARPIAIKTPLGDNALGQRSVVVKEQLSCPFIINAQFSSLDADINFDDNVVHVVIVSRGLAAGPLRLWRADGGRSDIELRLSGHDPFQGHYVPTS